MVHICKSENLPPEIPTTNSLNNPPFFLRNRTWIELGLQVVDDLYPISLYLAEYFPFRLKKNNTTHFCSFLFNSVCSILHRCRHLNFLFGFLDCHQDTVTLYHLPTSFSPSTWLCQFVQVHYLLPIRSADAFSCECKQKSYQFWLFGLLTTTQTPCVVLSLLYSSKAMSRFF